MAEARSRQLWAHTSSLLALLHNANRGKNEPAKEPRDFNPHRPEREAPAFRAGPEVLARAVFGDLPED